MDGSFMSATTAAVTVNRQSKLAGRQHGDFRFEIPSDDDDRLRKEIYMEYQGKFRGWKRRRLAVGAVAAALVLVTVACSSGGGSNAGSGSKASGGGSLTVYTTEVQAYQNAMTSAFNSATGDKVTFSPPVPAADLLQRVDAEMQAGGVKADVLQIVDHTIWTQHPNWFYNLSSLSLPNYASYPASAKWKNRCINVDYPSGGFVYNTKLVNVAHAPTTWQDLLNPYWKGHIVLTDPRASGPYMAWAILMQKKFGTSFLTKLAAQDPALVSSATTGAEEVASGAYWVSVQSFPSNSSALIASGAPLKYVVGSNPSAGTSTCLGIFKGTKNLKAAEAFLNWIMSPKAQSTACAAIPIASPLGNIPHCIVLPKGWTETPIDPNTGNFVGVGDPSTVNSVLQALKLPTG
jgi:iron(III) transport system substrate-binding protein